MKPGLNSELQLFYQCTNSACPSMWAPQKVGTLHVDTPQCGHLSMWAPAPLSVGTAQRGHPSAWAPLSVGTPQRGHPSAWAPLSVGTPQRGHPSAWAPLSVGTPQRGHPSAWAPLNVGTPQRGHPSMWTPLITNGDYGGPWAYQIGYGESEAGKGGEGEGQTADTTTGNCRLTCFSIPLELSMMTRELCCCTHNFTSF